MRIERDRKLGFDDVMIAPQRTTIGSRRNIQLERTFQFYWSDKKWTGIPIVAANMDSIAGKEMAAALSKFKMITPLHKYHECDEIINIVDNVGAGYAWMTIGFGDDELNKAIYVNNKVDGKLNLVIDVANGHMDIFVDFCKNVRDNLPHAIIMAGNIASTEMAQELIIRGGVDIVKAGISQGGQCKTFDITGVGYPQFSCVTECAHVVHGLRNGDKRLGLVCSDGGCKTSGDICKAFGGGADFVMIGTMLAGTSECCGEFVSGGNGPVYMKFYGMSSKYAQDKHDEYKEYRASEGDVNFVMAKGPVDNIIREILGGLRSCCTYSGASSLKDLHKTAKFITI